MTWTTLAACFALFLLLLPPLLLAAWLFEPLRTWRPPV